VTNDVMMQLGAAAIVVAVVLVCVVLGARG